MNSFKRGEEPLKALDIGTINNAPHIRSLATRIDDMDMDGYIRTSFRYIDSEDCVSFLREIESGKISIEDIFITTTGENMEESRLSPLSEHKGKYLKYIYYPRHNDMKYGLWDDSGGPQEFAFKIPK
jgi:hypothetical protein